MPALSLPPPNYGATGGKRQYTVFPQKIFVKKEKKKFTIC